MEPTTVLLVMTIAALVTVLVAMGRLWQRPPP